MGKEALWWPAHVLSHKKQMGDVVKEERTNKGH